MSRRAPVLLCALALAGCGDAARTRTALSPAPVLAGPCRTGAAPCMDAVVSEMSRRLAAFGCDHRAPFLSMYRQVSREVRRSVRGTAYHDPAYVARLDAVFATLYFRAADRWRQGRRDGVPRAWRMAFSAAQGRRVSGFGDMLLGMNAHISRDLPFAIEAVGLRRGDVVAVNDDIRRAQAPMLRDIARRYDSDLVQIRRLSSRSSPARIGGIIAAWRLEALDNARDLLAAKDVAARRAVASRIDANAALRSLLIWRATQYPGAHATDARDAFCLSRS